MADASRCVGLAWLACVIGASAGCSREPAATPAGEPRVRNVVLVSIDTLRADHLQAYGYQRETSPFLAELAGRGVVFEQAIAQSPWTLPSHAALLNSAHPSSIGSGPWEVAGRIPAEAISIAEVLGAAGLRTRAVVNGGFLSKTFGLDQGFELYTEHGEDTAGTVRRGLRWLDKRDPGERFFLFLHTYEVHEYSPPPETAALLVRPYEGFLHELKGARASYVQDRGFDDEGLLPQLGPDERRFLTDLYDASIRSADDALRELWLGLEERGLTDGTLVVVTSDHGEELFERGGTGHGYTLHDENVHVPLILAHPSLPARRVAAQVRLIDVAPTLVDWLGLAPPGEWQGVRLGPWIDGAAGDLSAVSEQAHTPFVALRRGGLKYIRGVDPAVQLFDLTSDPGERRQLAGTGHPDEATLRAELEAWIATHDAWPPPGHAEPDGLDPGLLEELRDLGYLGE